jgi:hypothetical protein
MSSSSSSSSQLPACPECKKANLQSEVSIDEGYVGLGTSTVVRPLIDQNGNKHYHDEINVEAVGYACTQGHQWQQAKTYECHCGWTRK